MSLFRSGLIVAVFTFLSRIFGLVRELFIAATFGTGMVADSVNVAFKLPNLFRRIFGEGALSLVFIPIFNQRLASSASVAKKFSSEVFGLLILVLFLLVVVMEILMPQVILILAPGFYNIAEKYELTILLSRITMPYLICISLVALYGGILNSIGRFSTFAAMPVIMNIIIIAGTYFLQPLMLPEFGIAWSIIIAGFLQLVLMILSIYKSGMFFIPGKVKFNEDTKSLAKGLGPAILTSGVAQINLFISQSVASFIPGAVSILSYAERIYQFPLSIIGIAFGTILLPKLSRLYKMNEIKEANKTLNDAIKFSLFLSIPCVCGMLCLSTEIIRIIYMRGAFTEADSINTSYAMSAFALGLPAFILAKVLMPAFYAAGDTKTPLKLTIYSLSLNTILNILLMYPFSHIGIALGSSIAAWVNIYLLVRYIRSRELLHIHSDLGPFIFKVVFITFLMSVFLLIAKILLSEKLMHGFIVFKSLYLCFIIIFAIIIYLACALLLGLTSKGQLLQLCRKN